MQPNPRPASTTATTPLTGESRAVLAVFATSTADKTPATASLVITANGDDYEPATFALPMLDGKTAAAKTPLPGNSFTI